jgi:hypothetical protein
MFRVLDIFRKKCWGIFRRIRKGVIEDWRKLDNGEFSDPYAFFAMSEKSACRGGHVCPSVG